MAKLAERTRNAGTWTEARYWQQVRSSLRKGFQYWKPMTNCLLEARRECKPKKGNQKWEYQCAKCKKWWKRKEVQKDHIVPVGSLKCPTDLEGFLKRLTCEDGFQVLCKACHQAKTNKEREEARK